MENFIPIRPTSTTAFAHLSPIQPAQPPVVAIDAILLVGRIGMKFSITYLVQQNADTHFHVIENHLVDGVRGYWISRRSKQQIPAFDSDARFGAQCLSGQIR